MGSASHAFSVFARVGRLDTLDRPQHTLTNWETPLTLSNVPKLQESYLEKDQRRLRNVETDPPQPNIIRALVIHDFASRKPGY